MPKRKNKLDQDAQLAVARIILAEPAKYQGALREWALLFLQKHKNLPLEGKQKHQTPLTETQNDCILAL